MSTAQLQQTLVRLLLNMFSVSELERLIRFQIDADLVNSLPTNAAPITFVTELVLQLTNKGLLDRAFFNTLISERPRRAAEIEQTAAVVLSAAPPPPNPSYSSSAAGPLPDPPRPIPSPQQLDFIVFTALSLESIAVLAQLTPTEDRSLPSGTLVEIGNLKGSTRRVGMVEVGAGNLSASSVVTDTIVNLRPRALLFVGVAGGIKDVKLGDVVASTKVYGYESGKTSDTGFQPRPNVGESSYRLVQRARTEGRRTTWLQRLPTQPQPAPEVHIAPIAAGEKVLAGRNTDLFKFLREHYGDAVAIEMEGRGFLMAAAMHQVEAMVIRGISDMVDADKSAADASGSQPKAAAHAAAFAAELMANVTL